MYLEARVLELETCFSDPSNDKCTLGNYKIAKSNITAQMRALQSKLLKKEATWDQVGEALQVANNVQEIANTAQQTASSAQETASAAQTAADNAEQTANTAQTTAENAQQTATNAENTANNALETANNAQFTANGKNKIFRQSTQPTGAFAVGDLWFDTANGNRVSVWDGSQWVLSQFGDMAIANIDAGSITTGTLDADKVTVKNLTAGSIKSLDGLNINDQFIVDENGNVTFKGNLAGATGTFSGNISTSADANVGKNVNLGGLTDYAQKKITFNDQAFISSDGTLLSLRGPNTITLTNNNGASIEMDGNTVNISGVLSVDGYIYVDPNKLRTSMTETSNCGVAGVNALATSGVFAGTWQSFKVTKTYTPTSVTLTTGDHNLTSLAGVQTTGITVNGFWLYLQGNKRQLLIDIGGELTMLKNIYGTKLTIVCNQCRSEFEEDITGKTINFMEEFGAYENFPVICPNCQTIEFFNMNLPDEQEDYPLELMPQNDQINRTNVRKLKDLLLNNAAH